MPELPEVETVCRGLAPHIEGLKIADVIVRNPRLRQTVPADFATCVRNLHIQKVSRRAKYILLHCDRDMTLVIHLGMSGSLTLRPTAPVSYRTHEHVAFILSDGGHLVYHDPRRFGLILPCHTSQLSAHKLFAALGPEPLDDSWTEKTLYDALHNRSSPIKTAIMDQGLVVGVGNIYACEALFLSGIHPVSPASAISRKSAQALHTAIRSVLKDAIASGGSTLRDYVRSSGDPGYFQHSFRVYGRQNLPCFICNTPIAQIRQSGRSSFYCPTCQRKGKPK